MNPAPIKSCHWQNSTFICAYPLCALKCFFHEGFLCSVYSTSLMICKLEGENRKIGKAEYPEDWSEVHCHHSILTLPSKPKDIPVFWFPIIVFLFFCQPQRILTSLFMRRQTLFLAPSPTMSHTLDLPRSLFNIHFMNEVCFYSLLNWFWRLLNSGSSVWVVRLQFLRKRWTKIQRNWNSSRCSPQTQNSFHSPRHSTNSSTKIQKS